VKIATWAGNSNKPFDSINDKLIEVEYATTLSEVAFAPKPKVSMRHFPDGS
jgi:hypothetical protein